MNLANNKKIWLLAGVIALLLIPLYSYLLRTGRFIHMGSDLLLIPLRMTENISNFRGNSAGIYVVSPSEKSEFKIFFNDPASVAFDFPLVQDKKFFCVGYAWINQNDVSKLYMADPILPENNRGKVIMQVDGEISFPALTKDLKKIYYLKKKKLYRWNRGDEKEEMVWNGDIYTRFLLHRDESIFCIDDENLVKLIPNGSPEILLKGVQEIAWYEKDKIILYVSSDTSQIGIYQLDNQMDTKLGTFDGYSLALSGNKKCLAMAGSARIFDLFPPDSIYIDSIDGTESLELTYCRRPRKNIIDHLCWLSIEDIALSE